MFLFIFTSLEIPTLLTLVLVNLRYSNEPRCEKTRFLHMRKQRRISASRIIQSFYFLNPQFQASSHLLWLYSPVCVGPGRKPRRSVFSQRGTVTLLKGPGTVARFEACPFQMKVDTRSTLMSYTFLHGDFFPLPLIQEE